MPDALTFHVCDTSRGWVGLLLSLHGLRATTLPRASRDEALRELTEMGATAPASEPDLADLPERIRALASGRGPRPERSRRANLAVHIDWTGISPFRRAVLEEAMRIPAGQTRSYGWLAERVGRPRAARAVGRVMATNPWPLVVPCHRVIGSDGGLHGYGGGLRMKETLLRAEGAI